MLTQEQIKRDLTPFAFAKGKPVLVHSSYKSTGGVEGGVPALLAALIDFFCDRGGLLLVPTHTWSTGILDLAHPSACIGALPTVAAGHPDAHRSLSPTHSVAVFGEPSRAAAFAAGEDDLVTPVSPLGCHGKLCDEDGYVLLLGVGHNRNTYLHCVEEMLEVPNRLSEAPIERTIIQKDGTERILWTHGHYARGIRDVSANYPKYEPAFRYHGAITDGTLGEAKLQLCSARKMRDTVALIRRRSQGRELLADDTPLSPSLYE